MRSRHYLIAAVICGGLPLGVGSFIFYAWRITHWGIWQLLGLLTLIAGLGLFLAGLAHLWTYILKARREDKAPVARIFATSVGVLALLLANFPVASHCMSSALDIITHFKVAVENQTGEPVTEFHIGGSYAEDIRIPLIQPGETIIRLLSTIHRQSIDCTAMTATGKPISGAYPDSTRHHGYRILIEKGGTMKVLPNDGRPDRAPDSGQTRGKSSLAK